MGYIPPKLHHTNVWDESKLIKGLSKAIEKNSPLNNAMHYKTFINLKSSIKLCGDAPLSDWIMDNLGYNLTHYHIAELFKWYYFDRTTRLFLQELEQELRELSITKILIKQ